MIMQLKRLIAIACLSVLLIQPAYALGCGGPFDGANACPLSTWTTFLIFWPILVPLLILAFSFSMLASCVIFYFVWLFFLKQEFIRRNWRSELDRYVVNRCVWTWVPIGMLLGHYAAIRAEYLIFPYDYLTGWSYLLFIHMVQIVLGVLWFCIVAFHCRNPIFNALAYGEMSNRQLGRGL